MTFASKGSKPDIDSDECRPWFPPLIDAAGNILPSAEKEDRQRQALEKKRRNEVVGQTIQRPKKLKPMTAKQLSDLSDSAYQDGYAAGFKQGEEDGTQKGHQAGLTQGLDESRSQAEKQRKQLLQLIDGLLTPFDQQTKQIEKMLLDTVVTLTKSMTQRELSSNSSQIQNFVREALLALPSGSDNIAIHVHPDDLALLKDFYVERINDWQLLSDPRITQGGCKVETKQSLVDFSVESRLQDLCKQFLEGKLIATSTQNDSVDDDENSSQDNTRTDMNEDALTTDMNEDALTTDVQEVVSTSSSPEKPSVESAVPSPAIPKAGESPLVSQQAVEMPGADNSRLEPSVAQPSISETSGHENPGSENLSAELSSTNGTDSPEAKDPKQVKDGQSDEGAHE